MTACPARYQRGSYDPRDGTAVCDSCGQRMFAPAGGVMPPHEMPEDGVPSQVWRPTPEQPERPQPQPQPEPLPLDAVAGIDQRLGRLDEMLRPMIARYRMIATNHGSAAAVGSIAADLHNTKMRAIPNLVDVLAYAISLLAEQEDS